MAVRRMDVHSNGRSACCDQLPKQLVKMLNRELVVAGIVLPNAVVADKTSVSCGSSLRTADFCSVRNWPQNEKLIGSPPARASQVDSRQDATR